MMRTYAWQSSLFLGLVGGLVGSVFTSLTLLAVSVSSAGMGVVAVLGPLAGGLVLGGLVASAMAARERSTSSVLLGLAGIAVVASAGMFVTGLKAGDFLEGGRTVFTGALAGGLVALGNVAWMQYRLLLFRFDNITYTCGTKTLTFDIADTGPYPFSVHAHVYAGVVNEEDVPDQPMDKDCPKKFLAPGNQTVTLSESDGDITWPDSGPCTVAIWGAWEFKIGYAVRSCGSGSGSGSAGGGGGGGALRVGVHDTFARAYRVGAPSFGEGVFEGPWDLEPTGSNGGIAWANGGDGVATPHVELRIDSPTAEHVVCLLRLDGHAHVYEIESRAWKPLGENDLLLRRNGGTNGHVPERVVVVPS